MLVAGFHEYRTPGRRLAERLGCPYREVDVHAFPDGEHKLTLPLPLPEHLVVCRSLNEPNAKLVDLMLVAGAARENGVRRLTLVAPYLCYMRQDIAFHPGEAVSQRIVGRLLAELFDTVITVDPHLHPMAAYLSDPRYRDAVLIGPDAESRQWVSAIAARTGHEYGVARKQRADDRSVRIALPEIDVAGRRVVLVDDVISTGQTMAVAARMLLDAGATAVECLVTHVLPGRQMQATLQEAGIETLASCDSIPHVSNRIELASLLAAAVTDEPAR
jgi:ribose-phosphate pyrophosphokinase